MSIIPSVLGIQKLVQTYIKCKKHDIKLIYSIFEKFENLDHEKSYQREILHGR